MRNRRTVAIGGESVEVEASILAASVYADEFVGKLEKPYVGVLEDDMLATYGRSRTEVSAYVEVDKDGKPVLDENGKPTVAERGGVEISVPNPEYRGVDAVALLRYVWAMAVAAGSIRESWEDFGKRMEHADFVMEEVASAFATVIYDLGGNCIFRKSKRRGDAGESDEGQQREVEPADGGGEGVA